MSVEQTQREEARLSSPVDKINLYSLMKASLANCYSILNYEVPELDGRGREVRRIIECTAYIRRNNRRLLEALALEIIEEVIARTPSELRPEVYHREHDTVPFRIKKGQSCPLTMFELEDSFTLDRQVAERAHGAGAIILEDKDERPEFEIYSHELPEQLLFDWRRAPQGEMTFATCCIYRVRERWYMLEVPGEGDNFEADEIRPLLNDEERAVYEECLVARG